MSAWRNEIIPSDNSHWKLLSIKDEVLKLLLPFHMQRHALPVTQQRAVISRMHDPANGSGKP